MVIGKKSDAHDSKESPRFASRLNKMTIIMITVDASSEHVLVHMYASSNKHNVHTHSFLCLIPVDHLPSDEHQILEKTENESISVDQMSEKLKHIWDIC